MDISKKTIHYSWWYIPIFITLFRYNIGAIQKYIYINKIVLLVTLFLSISIMLKLRKGKFGLSNYELGWIFIYLCFMCLRNWNNKEGNFNQVILYGYMFAFMALAKYSTRWLSTCCKMLMVLGFLHLTVTILFTLLPSVYHSYILHIVDPDFVKSALENYNKGYISGLCNHYSSNGSILALGFGISFSYSLIKKEKKFYTLAFLMLCGISLTGKRAHAVFAALVAFTIYFFKDRKFDIKKILKIIVVIGVAGGCVMILARYIPSLLNTFNRLSDTDDYSTMGGRIDLYMEAIKYFNQHKLFGVGWAGYPNKVQYTVGAYYSEGFSKMHAHNVYLEMLAEVGITGFVCIVSLILYSLYRTYCLMKKNISNIRLSDYEKIALIFSFYVQMFFILYCFTGNPLYDASQYMTYFVACTIPLVFRKRYKIVNGRIKN